LTDIFVYDKLYFLIQKGLLQANRRQYKEASGYEENKYFKLNTSSYEDSKYSKLNTSSYEDSEYVNEIPRVKRRINI
jgi:hypothetical protein